MSKALSRRGFARAAVVGATAGAVALLRPPRLLAQAEAEPLLRSRFRARLERGELVVDLYLQQARADGAGVELPIGLIDLSAKLSQDRRAPKHVELRHRIRPQPRVMRPGSRTVILPAGREVLYDTYDGAWPAGMRPGEVELQLRTTRRYEVDLEALRRQPHLAALGDLQGRAWVVVPG